METSPAPKRGMLPDEHQAWLTEVIAEAAPELDPEAGEALLEDWVLVAAWVGSGDGEVYLTRTSRTAIPRYRINGLLHAGLHESWDD